MAEPLDAVTAMHNAFRRDMEGIDIAALDSARGKPGLASAVERFRFFNEVLVWHAHGEELAIFPAVEGVSPSVAEAYERDHRGLDSAFDALSAAVSARDALETARATAAFKFHLDIHLGKEDAHRYRLIRERVPVPDQLIIHADRGSSMASKPGAFLMADLALAKPHPRPCVSSAFQR